MIKIEIYNADGTICPLTGKDNKHTLCNIYNEIQDVCADIHNLTLGTELHHDVSNRLTILDKQLLLLIDLPELRASQTYKKIGAFMQHLKTCRKFLEDVKNAQNA